MCKGFGAIVDKELNVWFSEPNEAGDVSHSEIIERLGWQDNLSVFLRHFVRAECAKWTMDTFRFDEDATLPGWADAEQETIRAKVAAILAKIAPAYAEYAAKRDAAHAEYAAKIAPADAEYEAKRDAADAEMIAKIKVVPGYVAK